MRQPVAALVLAVAAGLCVAPAAYAQTPADAEVVQVQELLGFGEAAILHEIETGLGQQPEFARYSVEQRTCLIDALRPEVESELRDAFKSLFVDDETVRAWLRFGKTPGGARFTGLMRAVVDARIEGAAPPDFTAEIARMSDAERADVAAFMASPAAAVLKKPFPEWKMPAGTGKKAARQCAVEWDQA